MEIHAAPGQEKAVTEYAFRNDGVRPVRFVTLRPNCDCLTATANQATFAPGESGTVRVVFTVGARLGRQEKFVTVATDDPAEKAVELLLVVEIPELVAIRPPRLSWERGAKTEAKVIAIAVAEPGKAVVTEAQCSDPLFTVTLEPFKSPGAYRLKVLPADASQAAQAVIRLTTIVEGRPVVSVIMVAIK